MYRITYFIYTLYIDIHLYTPAKICVRADAQDHFSRIRSMCP